jgi:hypothetical protein
MKNLPQLSAVAAVCVLCVACSSTSPSRGDGSARSEPTPATASAAGPAVRVVKSRDGSFSGEVVGTPRAGSSFARLEIGMDMAEVQKVMGRAPDRSHSYESGKRWIPFYFGNDARRVQALYAGEGCLIATGGNVWGGAGGDLIRIEFDPSGACYQP